MREALPGGARPFRPELLDAGVALAIASAVAVRGASFHAVPTDGGVWRGIAGPPSAARLALALAIGAAAALGLSRFPRAVRAPFLALALCLLPLVPVLTGLGPALLAFQGGAMAMIAAATLAVAVARAADGRFAPGAASLPWLFAAAFVFYAAWGTRFPGAGPQGDEPHYLVMAQSLLSDGDLDLKDDYAGREYAAFYGGELAPHTSPNSPRGHLYSMHSPGLPVLLLPAYAAGGYRGAQLLMSALAALAAALLHRLVLAVLKDERVAAAAWALFAFTPPLPLYAVTLYPETLAALAIVAFLLAGRSDSGRALWWATLFAAVLPWAHTKYIPLAAAGLAFAVLRRHRWTSRAAGIAAFAASLGLLGAFFRAHYGSASFAAALGPADVAVSRAPWGAAGAFFDRQYGMLVVAPALLLALPGLAALWRRRTGDGLRALVLAALVIAPAGAYVGWWGGAAPPARYVLPVAGPMVLALAAVAPRARGALAALGAFGLVIIGLAADTPRLLRNRPDGESLLLGGISPAADLNAWLPSFVLGGTAAVVLAASVLAALAIAWHWRGRGLVAALVAYALVAHAVRDRPVVDRGLATQRLLWEWDDREGWSPSPLRLPDLAVPFDLPRRPWTLDPGEARNSRRINVPPGAYHAAVRVRALQGAGRARIELFSGDAVLAAAEVEAGETSLPVPLPEGGRGLAASATGISGRVDVESIALVPESVAPRAAR